MSTNGEGVVYTVKELISMLEKTLTDQLAAIGTRLEKIDEKLDDKATNLRVSALEERVRNLEISFAGPAYLSVFQRWIIGSIGVAIVSSLIYVLIGGH